LVCRSVGQNILLVVSSIFRLDLYVAAYSLAYLRLAAFIGMGLGAGHGVWSDIWLTIPTHRRILQIAAKAGINVAHSILVVDDDPHIRDVVRFAFEKTGMVISTAQDGKEALRQFDKDIHELVVLDIGMPEMDGLEAAARSGKPRIRRSCFCRPATRRSIASSGWKSAATTMSPSPSVRASWSRG
jgi:Response regulator receiver domain/Domain of unknown function (DUF4173)